MFGGFLTSKENKTPPIGLPKATATPAAAVAVKISRVLEAFCLYLLKRREMTFPVQTAKCTLGPSLPTDKPDAMANGKPIDLISNVHAPKNPFMTKPAMIHLISEIPEPAAYGENDLTSVAEMNANTIFVQLVKAIRYNRGNRAYSKEKVDNIVRKPEGSPILPFRAP